MYYTLRKPVRMRREPECVVLVSGDDNGATRHVHPLLGVLLALCDGQHDRQSLHRVLTEAFHLKEERAAELLARLDGDLRAYVREWPEPVPDAQRYNAVDFVYRPSGNPNLQRLSAPVSIAWLITERCPFDCAYCCISTRRVSDVGDEMTHEQALVFLEDCVATGVQLFTFHGGEPFVRQDTPELIGYLIENGVFVATSTKLGLSEDTVARLKTAGLDELQISIDTADPDKADGMVGHRNYLRGAFRNIDLLRRYGIEPTVNTVVTSRNVHEVPELIRILAARGVRKISLASYIRSSFKHDDALFAGGAELRAMAKRVHALKQELPDVSVDLCPLQDPRDASLSLDGFSSCSGGRSGLVIGGNGNASICDRLLTVDEAIVGNVREESLLEIWNGERLRAFVEPGAEAFGDTECADCGLKEACDWRIRCAYRSLLIRGRLFAPDHLCPVVPPPSIRFF
ncbi:MAG TPA: radical SAM protein [Thermoanaerobaculia bacterium]